MDPIPLEKGNYRGTYKLIGGEISLDLVNTVSWPGRAREHEWLDSPGNLTAWASATGLLDARTKALLETRPRAVSLKELRRVRAIRADLSRVIVPLATGGRPAKGAIERLNALLQESFAARRIDPHTGNWTWERPTTLVEILRPVIWNAAHVLTELDRSRIRRCPSCDWVFYDTTRNGSRRWCDMEDCGSRHKALRYYHRTRRR